jgi:hypothetical protein
MPLEPSPPSGHVLRRGLHHVGAHSDAMVKARRHRDERAQCHHRSDHDDTGREVVKVALHVGVLVFRVDTPTAWALLIKLR